MFDTNTKMDELFVQHLFLICLVIFFFSLLSFITIILEISGETFAQHISQDLALIVDHVIFTPNWARSIEYFFEYFILYYVTIDILLSLCCSIYIYIYIILKNRFITIELKNQSKHLSLSTIHKP